MAKFSDKCAVILGAAGRQNMGQAMARRFAKEGARVMVAGRHEDVLRELADEIGGAWHKCDITNQSDVNSLVDATTERFGRVDIGIMRPAGA